jgi:hypothetical protein
MPDRCEPLSVVALDYGAVTRRIDARVVVNGASTGGYRCCRHRRFCRCADVRREFFKDAELEAILAGHPVNLVGARQS